MIMGLSAICETGSDMWLSANYLLTKIINREYTVVNFRQVSNIRRTLVVN